MGRIPTTLLLAGGVAGPILFTLAFIVLGAIRPGYAPMRQFVSLLSLSDDGWTMTLTFLASGCLVIAGSDAEAHDRGSLRLPGRARHRAVMAVGGG